MKKLFFGRRKKDIHLRSDFINKSCHYYWIINPETVWSEVKYTNPYFHKNDFNSHAFTEIYLYKLSVIISCSMEETLRSTGIWQESDKYCGDTEKNIGFCISFCRQAAAEILFKKNYIELVDGLNPTRLHYYLGRRDFEGRFEEFWSDYPDYISPFGIICSSGIGHVIRIICGKRGEDAKSIETAPSWKHSRYYLSGIDAGRQAWRNCALSRDMPQFSASGLSFINNKYIEDVQNISQKVCIEFADLIKHQ